MPKISALPNQTAPDGADQLPINDVSATTTKRMTLTVLKEWFQSLTKWITTTMIGDKEVKLANIDLATLTFGNYSTSEVDTGFTWTDGSKIYKKSYNIAAAGSGATTQVPHGITGLASAIYTEAQYGNVASAPFYVNNTYWAYPRLASANIGVETGSSLAAGTCRITLYYTKV